MEKIINVSWRLKRLTKAESEVLEKGIGCDSHNLRKSFIAASGTAIQNLSRYEASLERAFYKALHELQRLQGIRLDQSFLAPMVIDI